MPKKERCIILIDGSNFYFKLKDLQLHNLLCFNFSEFAQKLLNSNTFIQGTYYIGKVRTNGTEKMKKLQSNQQKLFSHLKKQKFHYSLGYLLKSGDRMHEKGVDVNIAVDILVATYENQCDKIILVSSDTDLLPAVEKAQEKGKIVEYVGFSHMPSTAMKNNCSQSTFLKKEDILPFITSSK